MGDTKTVTVTFGAKYVDIAELRGGGEPESWVIRLRTPVHPEALGKAVLEMHRGEPLAL